MIQKQTYLKAADNSGAIDLIVFSYCMEAPVNDLLLLVILSNVRLRKLFQGVNVKKGDNGNMLLL